MRLVKRRILSVKKKKPDGAEYTVYTYMLDDGHIVTSPHKLEKGQRVEHFWSAKYDREILLPYGYNKTL